MPKNQEKIGFPMLTALSQFHILVLQLKKHLIEEKNTPFVFKYFYRGRITNFNKLTRCRPSRKGRRCIPDVVIEVPVRLTQMISALWPKSK